MRILHVATFLQGGAGRIIVDLAIGQRQAGHDVRVAADAGDEPGYSTYPEYMAALTAAGVPVTLLRSTFKRDIAFNTRAAIDLQSATQRWHPAIVHAHAATPGRVARLAGLGRKPAAGFLHTMHGWGIAKSPEHVIADIKTLELADGVVTPSAAAARTMRHAGLTRDDVQVIPYGIGVDSPSLLPETADVAILQRAARGRRIALCIGTIGVRKNQRLLIDALATDALRDVIAVFVGDGDACSLQERAYAIGVADRVVVLGYRSEASRYLALADVLVLPSRNEGLPLVVLEALRAGVPTVASSLPEIAEALDEGRLGFLFEPDDPAALSRSLCAALELSDKGASRAVLRRRFETLYCSRRMLCAYESLYQRIRLQNRHTAVTAESETRLEASPK